MNLLILVTAVAAILAYFMFGLTDIVVANSAGQIVNSKLSQALGVVNSDKLCFTNPVNMPSSITYFGNSREFYYAMKISRFPAQTVPGENNTLIFSIVNRRDIDKIIAAKSTDIDAEIILFDWDGKTGILSPVPNDTDPENSAIIIDPHAEVPVNSFVLIKEVFDGKSYLYIIACNFGSGGSFDVDCYKRPSDLRCHSDCLVSISNPNCEQYPSAEIHSQCQLNMQQAWQKINSGIYYQNNEIVKAHESSCLPKP